MNPTGPKYVIAALLKNDVPGLLTQADGFTAGVEGHAGLFPNHGPVVQAVKDARTALGDVYTVTSPLKSARKARSPEEKTLRNRLTDGARFVETCANNDPENGLTIIAASTFSEKAPTKRQKDPLTLHYGEVSGTVLADAKAAKSPRAFYGWRYSLDNGTTWTELAQTNSSKTLLQGLPVGKTVLVQVAITQKDVRGPWSDSATLLVH